MRKLDITTSLEVYDTLEELPQDVQDLMASAVEAREKAYAPYSNFKVGAAILLDNAKIVSGSNQENASYPSGLCAERTAVYYAGATYPNARMLKIAITARSLQQEISSPVPPCGACRQALVEYEVKQNEPIELYFMGETGEVMKAGSISEILPLVFDSNCL